MGISERLRAFGRFAVAAGAKAVALGGDVVFAPRALFVRVSRILEVTAELTADASVSRALRNDAILADAGTNIHRWRQEK